MLCRKGNRKACCTRGVLVLLLVFCFCCCYCIFSLIIYHFLTFPLSGLMKEVQGKPFGQRSDRLRTDKVHEYLNSLSIYRFYWTAQNTSPNLMIIHTWFRGLGPVSNVLKPLSGCVGVHGIRVKLALQTKHKGSKENNLMKKSLWFLLYCLLLISFVQKIDSDAA